MTFFLFSFDACNREGPKFVLTQSYHVFGVFGSATVTVTTNLRDIFLYDHKWNAKGSNAFAPYTFFNWHEKQKAEI